MSTTADELTRYYDASYPSSVLSPAPPAPATGAQAGTPGIWTPSGSQAPASVADLIAGVPNAVTAAPASLWTVGQYVQTRTAGTTGRAHWSGTAWVAGAAPVTLEGALDASTPEEPYSEPEPTTPEEPETAPEAPTGDEEPST